MNHYQRRQAKIEAMASGAAASTSTEVPARVPSVCRGTKVDGTACRTTLGISPDGFCLFHDPARAEQKKAVAAAGGRARGKNMRVAKAADPALVPKAPKTIEDAEKFASWLTHAVCTGGIDARTAHEAAVCLREFRGAAEKRIMEREIKALRKELADAKKTPRR